MKPLNSNKASELLTRIDNAIDGELISVVMNNPQSFTVEFSVQDKNRGYDWINIAFEVDGVIDAKLIDDSKLSFVDLSDGISLIYEEGKLLLAVGSYNTLQSAKSATLYLEGTTLKYEERPFKSYS